MSCWVSLEAAPGLRLHLLASPAGLAAIHLNPESPPPGTLDASNALLREAAAQITAYFARRLRRFDLPVDLRGTPFQVRVWNALREIPYGETRSYAQLASAIGAPRAMRAVGAANGRNPIPIVVPCHRVIGAAGSLVGYGGGLPLKRRLLELEARA